MWCVQIRLSAKGFGIIIVWLGHRESNVIEDCMRQLFLSLLFLLLVCGCEAAVGDACKTSNDCPIGMVCDTDSRGGYCLVAQCESNEECPENSVCVKFTKSQAYCLKKCKKNSDCRKNYSCRSDIGDEKFCYTGPDDTSYGRDETNELEFVSPAE